MDVLVRWQNAVLPSTRLTINVTGVAPGSVDLLVFQVTSSGHVRHDGDLVFFNNPSSPEGAITLSGPRV